MMVHKIFLSYLKDLETYFNFRSILKNIKQKIVYTYLMRGQFFRKVWQSFSLHYDTIVQQLNRRKTQMS